MFPALLYRWKPWGYRLPTKAATRIAGKQVGKIDAEFAKNGDKAN
jgi:hypothetical protein